MTTFTAIHVLLSLIGIGPGLAVLFALITAQSMPRSTRVFLVTTFATSVTGFFFPFNGFTPAIGVGIVSVLILSAVAIARYHFRLGGPWRWVYFFGAILALYFNSFVLVVLSPVWQGWIIQRAEFVSPEGLAPRVPSSA
jgi:hypothetical protein